MSDRHALRRENLRKSLINDEVDAFLVSSETNVSYLTGFEGDSSALIVTKDRELIVSDFRYEIQLGEECPGVETHIRPVNQVLIKALGEVIGKLGIARLAFEANALIVADHLALIEALPNVEFKGVVARVESLRAVKDDGEIALIRRAIDAAQRAFAMFRAGLRPSDSEIDGADALEHYLRRCGSSSAAFPPIVASGLRGALPHARPSPDARLDSGGMILVDWGATVGGYRSDLTRVLVTGKVGPRFETVYGTVLEAQRRAIALIRPGVRARDVDAEARSAIEAAGFGRFFGHGLGHGIGLDVHEMPRFRPESDDVLAPGMVVTVEPGIYLPNWGGVRIEDDVLVTPDGCEVLTSVPKAIELLNAP